MVERPGSWMLYMGRYPDREALAREDRRAQAHARELPGSEQAAEYALGLSLGRFDDRAAADRALEQLGQRGVRSARIVELAAPATQHLLRADYADAALAERLSALRARR